MALEIYEKPSSTAIYAAFLKNPLFEASAKPLYDTDSIKTIITGQYFRNIFNISTEVWSKNNIIIQISELPPPPPIFWPWFDMSFK